MENPKYRVVPQPVHDQLMEFKTTAHASISQALTALEEFFFAKTLTAP